MNQDQQPRRKLALDTLGVPEGRDRAFVPERRGLSAEIQAIVSEAVRMVLGYETRFKLRTRKRRVSDQEVLEWMVEALICDAVHRYCQVGPDGKVSITRSKRRLGQRSRYRSPVLGDTLPYVMDVLATPELAFLSLELGRSDIAMTTSGDAVNVRVQSTICAGSALIKRIERYGLWFDDLTTSPNAETIQLRGPGTTFDKGDLIEYEDTDVTNAWRDQMLSVNRYLTDADIQVDDSFLSATRGPLIDPYQRSLYRVFNDGSFSRGGRLYGGFWINMKQHDRLAAIVIDGENVASLDYNCMALSQLYRRAGVKRPAGDLYRIPGVHAKNREGVKAVINSAIYSDAVQSRLPKGTRPLFDRKHTYSQIIEAIKDHHEPVAPYLFTGVGMELMFEEAELMLGVVTECNRRGITALPVHDCVIVPKSKVQVVKVIMEDAFEGGVVND